MTFSKNLKRLRTDVCISQEKLANYLNVSQKTISSWETGRSEPSMRDIAVLAEVLGCTQEELIGIQKKQGNITFEDILVKVHDLNIEELKRLSDVVAAQLSIKVEIEQLEKAKIMQEQRLAEYARRLAELKGELK